MPAVARQGVLELPVPPQRPVPLNGQWGFAWQAFVDPDWHGLPTDRFADVPASWNALRADGKPEGENGWGSYVLLVNCPPGQSLAVDAAGQRTASRLFVNGTPVAAHGEPGPSAAESWAAIHRRVPITREFACPLRLTLHISNFDHRAGGFVRPITVASADVLAEQREAGMIYQTALLSAYLFTGTLALIFFAARPREPMALIFGLFCLAMAVYTDMIGGRLFLRPLPPQLDWRAYMAVEYLSWIIAMALFCWTLRGLFPAEVHRRAVQAVTATLGAAAVAVIVLPPAVYSYTAVPGQFTAVVVATYFVIAIVRAQRPRHADARVLLVGMLAVLAALAADLLLIETLGPGRKFAPIGFALFLLSPAAVIARRMTHALNAEERSRTLEENARLREDVERMSRHDLKTPLYSILAVTRMLREDAQLAPRQRELVEVLQGAGLRMLEMVNVSLSLFKMETGAYDFQPQAVNLREVVTRALVDLQPYAQANGVRLHLHETDRAPLYVRAEEQLCYSIVANLVKNAVEATAAGQQVSLRLTRGDPVVLEVHNPDPVAPEIVDRFFDKYVTAGKRGGTGLGTYSARLMARAQQGELRLRSSATEGTTLILTLRPLRGDPPAQALPAPATSQAPVPALTPAPAPRRNDGPSRQVLLVDDDEFARLVTQLMLPNPPFEVETATDGRAALEAMARRWPHDLLLDMEMPGMDGLETAHRVREYEARHGLPRCRVVMLSGHDDEASAARALAAGVDRFLVKPVSREQLLATLQALAPAESASE